MIIGAMNNPKRDLLSEIEWMGRMGLQFLDLTLEPPAATPPQIDIPAVRAALEHHHMGVVGHTAYYLPLASAFESLRHAAVEEVCRCFDVFTQLGATWVNVHADCNVPMHERTAIFEKNIRSLVEITVAARDSGLGIMIENTPGMFNTAAQLGQLLNPIPELGLHLDIGHCNLMTDINTADEIITAFGSRLRHVHMHDNKGGSADLHLPLGTGTVDVAHYVRSLRASGYDSTITLEVFTTDRRYLATSRDLLRELWDEASVEHVGIMDNLKPPRVGSRTLLEKS